MSVKTILPVLQKSPKYEEFVNRCTKYDTTTRTLSRADIRRIQEEYPEINLFPQILDDVIAITFISQVLMQNGYPKLKAYIDMKKMEILHIFVSK